METVTPVKKVESQSDDRPAGRLDAHLFVCTNRKGEGQNCGSKDSQELRDSLKAWAKKAHPEWRGRVRVNSSGCLGHCKRGITAVLYPEGVWFTQLKKDDHAVLATALDRAMNQDSNQDSNQEMNESNSMTAATGSKANDVR